MIDEFERSWKDVVLLWHLLADIQQNHEEPQLGYSLSWRTLKSGTDTALLLDAGYCPTVGMKCNLADGYQCFGGIFSTHF
jgi:hypothetical protein